MLNLHCNDCRFLLIEKDVDVIVLTHANGATFYLNPELIQTVESTPDTVITLVSNKKLIVKDTPEEISERFIEFRRKTLSPLYSSSEGAKPGFEQ